MDFMENRRFLPKPTHAAISVHEFFFKILFIYSQETERERGRDTGRGRSRLHAGSWMQDSIPGPRGHTLG